MSKGANFQLCRMNWSKSTPVQCSAYSLQYCVVYLNVCEEDESYVKCSYHKNNYYYYKKGRRKLLEVMGMFMA